MIRLLAIADPVLPVPPVGYGGTERIMYQVLSGLANKDYEITLLGKEGSQIPGKVIPYPDPRHHQKLIRGWMKWKFRRLLSSILDQFDVVYAVCRLDYLLPALKYTIPMHYSFHNPVWKEQVDYLLRHTRGKLILTACGKKMTMPFQNRAVWRPIQNSLDIERFPFQPTPQNPPYLAFLGRLTFNKGVKEAIEVARRVNLPLHIAGNISNEPGGREYFETEVKPQVDGKSVVYLGEMNDEQKVKHLGNALALLNLIQWDEPFGNVTIESMACGTPVIACPRGELPFVVDHGVTGFLTPTIDEAVQAVKDVEKLDRLRCRQTVEQRYSATTMVQKYDEVLQWVLSSEKAPPRHWNES